MSDKQRMRRALRQLFVPLADILLDSRFDVSLVIEELKVAFVESAHRNQGRANRPASINRISAVTGMSRNHVKDLLEQALQSPCSDELATPFESLILGAWTNSEHFQDEVGLPRALSKYGGKGTFEALVSEVVGESDVDSVLGRLLVSQSVRIREDGLVELTGRIYDISRDLPRILACGLSSLATTISRNWANPIDDGFCQRVAHSSRVQSANIPKLRRISKERIAEFLEQVDDILCAYESTEPVDSESACAPEGEKLSRVGVGAYYFEMPAGSS